MSLSSQETKQETLIEYKSGLTWRSWLALFYSAGFLMAVAIFFQLVTGGSGVDPAVFITTILFAEIARTFGSPLRKQEVCVIFYAVEMVMAAATGGAFLSLLFNGYLATSPLAAMFKDPYTGKLMIDLIPWWLAPHRSSEVYLLRTFLHPDWLAPIIVLTLTSFFSLLQQISLAMIMGQIYIEVEKLPFPFADIDASVIETLAERTPRRTLVFMLSSLIGLTWGIVVYAIPVISEGVFRVPAQVIPVPWVDLTHWTEKVLPGSCIGFATSFGFYLWGTFLSGNVVACILISSVSIWIIGNMLALKVFPNYFPEWAHEYTQGMNIALIYQRSSLWVWAGPLIGITIAVGVFPLAKYRKAVIQSFKSLRKLSAASKRAGYLPLHILLIMYLAGSLGSVAVFYYLIPDFPIYLVILMTVGYSFFVTLITGRMLGETGFAPPAAPYVWQATILGSGYPRIDAWFFSPSIIAETHVFTLKVFQLTETRPLDFIKTWVVAGPLSIVMSFFFVSLFWSIAPIPSGFYPATSIAWPVGVINTGIWATRQINIFRPHLILGSTFIVLAMAIIFEFIPAPFSLMGLAVGATMLPPNSFALLIGFLIGRYVLQRRMGRETWESIKPVVAGGVIAGQGVGLGVGVATVIFARSLWALPY